MEDFTVEDLVKFENYMGLSSRVEFEKLPPHLKTKTWTQEELFKEGDAGRIYIEYKEGDDNDVASLMSIFSKPPTRTRKSGDEMTDQHDTEQVTGNKRKRKHSTTRKRIRWDQKFDDESKFKYKTRIVELINACCRPGDLQENVWLADPYYRINLCQLKDVEKMRSLSSLVWCLTFTLMDFREDIHKKAKIQLGSYEGMTLHEIITSTNSYKDNPKVEVGRRSSLGVLIQDAILVKFGIDKETFKTSHYKRKEHHSENYFIVYRMVKQEGSDVSECDVVRAVLNKYLQVPADDEAIE